jgi:Rap1a immunity proteins
MSARIAASLLGAPLAFTATAALAEEDFESANYTMPGCRNFGDHKLPDENFREGFCVGIVHGLIYSGIRVKTFLERDSDSTGRLLGTLRRSECIAAPDEATLGQQVGVVVSYIEARPERMHESFRQLALEALRTAWPCR